MFKSILLSVALATSLCLSAFAEPTIVPAAKLAKVPELAAKCKPDCLVLDRQDFQTLQEQVKALAEKAFAAGVAAGAAKERGSV